MGRQDQIEAKLVLPAPAAEANPSRMALFDLSSSWAEGHHCPLVAHGYSRDGKKGRAQIEYGPLTDPVGRRVAVRVLAANTADPTAFIEAVTVLRDRFGLQELVVVGDQHDHLGSDRRVAGTHPAGLVDVLARPGDGGAGRR